MFRGFISLKEDVVGKTFTASSFSCTFQYKNIFVEYDEEHLYRNHQFLAFKNSEGDVIIINSSRGQSYPVFSSFAHLELYFKNREDYEKLSLVYFDSVARRVSLQRDSFGLRPIYYSLIEDNFLAFSTSIPQLRKFDIFPCPGRLDEQKIAQYLDWQSDAGLYSSSTFFKDIENVLPGQRVTMDINEKTSTYPIKFILHHSTFKTRMEYGEELKSLLIKSVASELNSSVCLGSELSGGLDSSSISAIIRNIDKDRIIHTFYVDTGTLSTDEHEYANEVATKINSNHHIIAPATNHIESAYLHTALYGFPDHMVNGASLNTSVIQNAVNFNCDTLFGGHGGDAVVGYGSEYIVNLFKNGDWNKLKSVLFSADFQNLSYHNMSVNDVKKTLYSLLATRKSDLSAYEVLKTVLKTANYFEIPLSYFVKNVLRKLKDSILLPKSIANKDFFNGEERAETYHLPVEAGNEISSGLYEGVFNAQSVLINEQLYLLDNHYGLQHKFPFYDKKVYELSLQIPDEIKYDNGRRRGHLREAMKGIVPEGVRSRTTKSNFGFYGRKIALEFYIQSQDLLVPKASVWNYVVRDEFQKSVKLIQSNNHPLHIYNVAQHNVFRTIYLAIWLDSNK